MVARRDDDEAYSIARHIIQENSKILDNPLFFTDESTYKILSKDINSVRTFLTERDENLIDLAITVGGDGTFLYAANQFYNREVPPLIAVQKGSLGFLCEYPMQHFFTDLENIFSKITLNQSLHCLRSMRIQGTLTNRDGAKQFHALNEISIIRSGSTSVIKLNIYVNDIFLTQFSGDGLLLSTPTGSSAYSASAGGPLIENDVDSIAIIPICPFSLSFRPIVFPSSVRIRIEACKTHSKQTILIQNDSQFHFQTSDPDWELNIQKSPYDLIKVREKARESTQSMEEWIQRIRNNMNWNRFIEKERPKHK